MIGAIASGRVPVGNPGGSLSRAGSTPPRSTSACSRSRAPPTPRPSSSAAMPSAAAIACWQSASAVEHSAAGTVGGRGRDRRARRRSTSTPQQLFHAADAGRRAAGARRLPDRWCRDACARLAPALRTRALHGRARRRGHDRRLGARPEPALPPRTDRPTGRCTARHPAHADYCRRRGRGHPLPFTGAALPPHARRPAPRRRHDGQPPLRPGLPTGAQAGSKHGLPARS